MLHVHAHTRKHIYTLQNMADMDFQCYGIVQLITNLRQEEIDYECMTQYRKVPKRIINF